MTEETTMTGAWPGALYSAGMADFVLRELEIGYRAAQAEDDDAVMGADFRIRVTALAQDDTDDDGWAS